jgi:hypothetical protein
MKCAACSRALQPAETLRVDGRSNGKPMTFFVHRPSEDGRCFRQVVFGSTDVISLVEIDSFEPIERDKPVPYRCPICVGPAYYGRLGFPAEKMMVPLVCPNDHRDADGEKMEVQLVPAEGFVERKVSGNINLSERDAVRAMLGL